MDAEGKHYRGMGAAVWLYLYLLLNANRRTGFLMRKIDTISRDMGVRGDSVSRWLKLLRDGGYIQTVSTGRCLHIQIEKWKPLSGAAPKATQSVQENGTRDANDPSPGKPAKTSPPSSAEQGADVSGRANDISKKENKLKSDIEYMYKTRQIAGQGHGFVPRTREELLALDLAVGLNDRDGLPLYLSYARRHPEPLLRKVLGEVKEVPHAKIKKSRGALFNHIIQQHESTDRRPGA